MKLKLLISTLLTITYIGCSVNVLHSALTVQPGKQFELGGNQKGAFSVQARNVGDVPVTLSERRVNGQTIALGTFAPGGQQTIRFLAGSAALITNSSAKSAQLNLVVTGDKDGLSMSEKNAPNTLIILQPCSDIILTSRFVVCGVTAFSAPSTSRG